ncbi:MAG: DNA glycosylase [Chloroflexota bacterium]
MEQAGEQNPGILERPSGTLNLEYTLTNGQLFRWRQTADGWWDVVTGARLIRIRQIEHAAQGMDTFEYKTFRDGPDPNLIESFFRLDVPLEPLYESWKEADPFLGGLAERFRGLRIVRQEPEECLLSFMCSTANFIPRIMKAIAIIARTWGEPIVGSDGTAITHAFPAATVLAELDPFVVSEKTGLEWRAGNLVKVAQQLAAKPTGWLEEVSKLDYATARGELQRIDGVGPKIADCVCLFAMAKDQAVPVDTHVWQLTRDRYLPTLKGKSVSAAGYAQVLNYFHSHFQKAGWAQQYLFFDHLLESREKRKGRET